MQATTSVHSNQTKYYISLFQLGNISFYALRRLKIDKFEQNDQKKCKKMLGKNSKGHFVLHFRPF